MAGHFRYDRLQCTGCCQSLAVQHDTIWRCSSGIAVCLCSKIIQPVNSPVRPSKKMVAQLIFQGNCMAATKILLVDDDET
jgi:hypothetical protein